MVLMDTLFCNIFAFKSILIQNCFYACNNEFHLFDRRIEWIIDCMEE